MSAGLQTRNKLHAALHPDVVGDMPRMSHMDGVPKGIPGGDATHNVVAAPSQSSVLIAQSSPPLTSPLTYLPNAHGLGTPLEAERTRAIRREQLYDKAFRIGGAIIVILVAMGGYGYMGRRDEPVTSGVAYYVKAQGLRVGQRACELDQHEGCLVCMHKDADGMALVSHHC